MTDITQGIKKRLGKVRNDMLMKLHEESEYNTNQMELIKNGAKRDIETLDFHFC